MLVHQILKSKGTDGVITVAPGSTVSDAARLLSEKRIGSVVVSGDGQNADGILSERDIVRELGKRGPECMSDRVEQMMTSRLQTCGLSEPGESVVERMTEGRFRHMPVLEDGKMVGLITLGDVVKSRLAELKMEKDALEGMIMGF